jgi:hypothetical protein
MCQNIFLVILRPAVRIISRTDNLPLLTEKMTECEVLLVSDVVLILAKHFFQMNYYVNIFESLS